MSHVKDEMLLGLQKAMQAERTGFEFYKMAAKTTNDPQGKQIFDQLAKEEAEHFRYLSKHYLSLKKTGQIDPEVKLSQAQKLETNHPIFSTQLQNRIKEAHFEMSALAVAVQLELNGINHYKDQAEKTELPELKKFFQALVNWETQHYEAFLKQQEMLQEEYWNAAGFDPF